MADRASGNPHPTISRQRRWQLQRKADGLCMRCGQRRTQFAGYCDACERKHTAAQMRRYHQHKQALAARKAK